MEVHEFHAFTANHEALAVGIVTEVTLESRNYRGSIKALWDTGASSTCVSKEAAEAFHLKYLGESYVKTAGGPKPCKRYLTKITLPNNVAVEDVEVYAVDINDQGVDALIGMDIITSGDFAITNYGGKTVCTFRIPSKKNIDFVPEANADNIILAKRMKSAAQGKRR